MRKALVVLPFIFFSQLLIAQTDLNKLSWLEGSWSRTNGKPGRSTHEHWTKISNAAWKGLGVTLHGSDTAFVEKMKLISKDGSLYYVADVPENKRLVYFKFTEMTDTSFTCENPDHDFPKKIIYILNGNLLKATISGNGKSIEYLFEKM